MSYAMILGAREQMIKDLRHDPSHLYIGASRKSFQVVQNKISALFEDGITDNQLLELILYHGIRHVIQNSLQKSQSKLDFLKKISFNHNGYFDMDFNILGENSTTKVFEFNHYTSREKIIHQVCEFANLDPTSSRSSRPLQTVEELLMNAQITAVAGKPKDIKIMSHLKVEFDDQNLICLSAFDPYGSLEIKKFVKKVEAGQALGLDQAMNFGKGGAGVGSSLIFQNCDSLFLGVQPLKKTRVSVVMPFNQTERKYEGIQKSIHIFNNKVGAL